MSGANSGKRRIGPKYGPLSVKGANGYLVRLNPPIQLYADLMSGQLDRIIPALAGVVQEHPLLPPDGDDPLPFTEWPLPEVTDFVEAYGALMAALPPA